jgi:PAS domain S-box-containing protein/putative nucleotidyltransferase with HDIG domain
MKVLYVEDNPLDADLTSRLFRKELPESELQITDRIENAWNLITTSEPPIDLILVDLILPDGNGIDLLARLRQHQYTTPIIMMAGSSDEEIAIAALKSGANDYIVKNGSYLNDIPKLIQKTLLNPQEKKGDQYRSIRLLYAERNAMDIDLTYRHMSRFAPYIRMDSVHSAEEALPRIYPREGVCSYDVIMLDYRLPGKNGLELLEELRRDKNFALPVIIVTGQGDQEAVSKAHQLGAIDYLIKTPGYLFQLPIMIENAYHQSQLIREHLALQRSENLFRLLAENAGDMIYRIMLSPEQKMEYISPAVSEIIGYTAEEIYQNPDIIFRIIHPDDQTIFAPMAHGQLQPKETIIIRMIRKDGIMVWVEEKNVYIHNKAGEVIALEGIARDVTEQRKADTERRKLLEETRRRVEELEAVNQILIASRAANTLEEILAKLLDESLSFLGLENGIIWIFSQEEKKATWCQSRGWFTKHKKEICERGEQFFPDIFHAGKAFRMDFLPEKVQQLMNENDKEGVAPSSSIILPILANKILIGVLFVLVPQERSISENDFQLMDTLASITGTAAYRIQLFEQTENQLKRLTALRVVDAAISSSLDLKVIFNVLIEHVISELKIDAAAVLLFNPVTKSLDFAAGSGFQSATLNGTHVRISDSLAGLAVIEQRVISIKDTNEHPLMSKNVLYKEHGFTSYIAVPLISKGNVRGVLELYHSSVLPGDVEWMNFLKTLSNQVAIALDNAELFDSLQRSNIELSLAYDATIVGWSRALELRDRETKGHSMRVTDLTIELARKMNIPSEELIHMRRGALLHDIGKMGIPDGILHKPGPLTDEEWVIMRKHPVYAYNLLSPIEFLKPALEIPYSHHERFNGSGYPRGLKGKTIPLSARIFAVIDVWDALGSDRPYRDAWPEEKVLQYIIDEKGIQFDPDVVTNFLELRLVKKPELSHLLIY